MNTLTAIDDIPVYLSTPEQEGKYPGLIVIHEIWGLTDHIKDAANRFAAEGYAVVAPNLFADVVMEEISGGVLFAKMADPATRDEAQKTMRELTAPVRSPEFALAARSKLQKCFAWLASNPQVNGKVAVIGYCFGGTYAFALAADEPKLAACLPYYGQPPQAAEIPKIQAPILAFYGDKDERLMETLPELKEGMAAAGKNFEAVVYPETGHAFFNDTNPMTYKAEAAQDAWQKSLAFLKQHIG